MIANMMMYQWPQLVDAHNRYWALIREELSHRGLDSPEVLSQDAEEFAVWKNPELVLSQTCGMPYRTWLHDKVQLVGTPDYGLEGCPAGHYRSAIVVRAGDAREALVDYANATFAYNQTFSQSGYGAPYFHCAPLGFWFENRMQSHGHLMSAQAVAEGRADIASLDAVSWRMMQRYEPWAKDLRVLEWTTPTPGLPLIAAAGADAEATFDAVQAALVRLNPDDKTALSLKSLVKIAKEDYLAVPNPPGTSL
ncbi:PhnD/SsuA/transferrin family substrate-binding protein [Lentibacter algarum]|uniref:phosphate/phosphite/phosphonate ABC transporter substrate-binding protein n=1 Tax=Lentibacter algarum TaxID=576131 RepID=UPI001C0788F4|nr:PhnD/SsuA/transferrin family substrate-binding protein [Lentibacter algarum]MBU2980585.1 PhnD/SsuA/transferrin family substrate-binding protein [Lentibacter algarum]